MISHYFKPKDEKKKDNGDDYQKLVQNKDEDEGNCSKSVLDEKKKKKI